MSGDEDTSEWEPIPSLSSLSPFSSPALSFLVLSNDPLAHDSDPSFHGKHHEPDHVSSHTPATPRPKTHLDLTPPPPSTTRSMHDFHQAPTQPTPLQLSSLGLGLHHLGIGPPIPLSPLHHKDSSWMLSGHHEEIIKEETSITHDADDEDEEDERDEREIMNKQSLIYDQAVDGEDEEDEQHERNERDVMKRLSLIYDRQGDGEDEDEGEERELMNRQSLVYDEEADEEGEDETDGQEVIYRQSLIYDQRANDENEDETDGQVINRQSIPYYQGTDRLRQSLIYDHDEGTDRLRHSLAYDNDQGTDEITQSSKAILVDRLEDLLHRLASPSPGTDLDTIDVLHAKVDEMEIVLEATSPKRPGTAKRRIPEILQLSQTLTQEIANQSFTQPSINLNQSMSESMPDTLSPSASLEILRRSIILPPALATTPPPWLLPSTTSSPIKHSEIFSATTSSPTQPELDAAAEATNEALEAAKEAARAHSEMTERIAAEAGQLRKDLATVISKLQTRREETDHIHTLLIQRAEAAAERILDLEKELSDLEDDLASSESELRHLRLKLRAVETLVNEFVDPDETDPDLFQSIANWKADWALVRERILERKRGRKERRERLRRREMGLGGDGNGNEQDGGGGEEGESTLTTSLAGFMGEVAGSLGRGL